MTSTESKSIPSVPTIPTIDSSESALVAFARDGGAILVVGHGTRNPAGSAQLLNLVAQMQNQLPTIRVEGCFLELAEPSIEVSVQKLSGTGIRKIVTVPVLLFTAAHAKEDIPQAIACSAVPLGIEVIGQTESLGTHSAVLMLVRQRFEEVIQLEQGIACPPKGCARVKCSRSNCTGLGTIMGRVGLAMAGRGTTDENALAHMRRLTELHASQIAVVQHQTGFFAGGLPNVDELLREASFWDCDTVVVQPHLLFEGDLIDQLRAKVALMQVLIPEKNWLIGRTLGADPRLAEVLCAMAKEILLSIRV